MYYSYPSLILWGSLVYRFGDLGVLVPKPQMSKLRTSLSSTAIPEPVGNLGTQGTWVTGLPGGWHGAATPGKLSSPR